MAAAIAHDGAGVAFVGVKEAWADAGVSANGENLVSAETMNRMRTWLESRGVHVQEEAFRLPTFVARFPADPAVISQIRGHENTEYIEPDGPVNFDHGANQRFVSVVPTSYMSPADREGLSVYPGDVIEAELIRFDGSSLRAIARVR